MDPRVGAVHIFSHKHTRTQPTHFTVSLPLTMSLVSRTSALQRQILRSRVFVPSRGAHDGYHVSCAWRSIYEQATTTPHHSPSTLFQHIPFRYDGPKAIFGAKVAAFLLTGFSIPGIAAYYQMYVYDLWALVMLSCLQVATFRRKSAGGA